MSRCSSTVCLTWLPLDISDSRPPLCAPTGLLCDLLWSDPDKDVQGWGENDRGVSFTFGADVVSKFLNRHDLDLICRAHQVSRPPGGTGAGSERGRGGRRSVRLPQTAPLPKGWG